MTATHPAARRYLKELHKALVDLPRARRQEIVAEIGGHIDEALAPDASEAAVRSVLDDLGDPETIAADARDRFGITRSKGGVLEGLAIGGLLVGGIVLPVVGWLVGVVLLWVSGVWTVRDKLIGTFVIPGGLASPLLLTMFAAGVSSSCEVEVNGGGSPGICSSEIIGSQMWANIVLVILVIAPIATAIHLGRRAWR